MQTNMLSILIGALLLMAGVLYMAAQAIWRGRMSEARPRGPAGSDMPPDTLEPRHPTRGLSLKAHWPGLALMAAGAILLLVVAIL